MPRLWPETDGFLEQRPRPGYRFVAAEPTRASGAIVQGAGAARKNTILPCNIACRLGSGLRFESLDERTRPHWETKARQ
jgi:hypothetical protein